MNRQTPPLSGIADVGACSAPGAGAVAPGESIESPDYAFAFRLLEPVPERPSRLLVALHGADGDELQFADALAGLRAGDVVVLPRGPRTLPGERTGWYREAVRGGDAHADADEFDDSLQRLVLFVGQLRARYDVAPDDTVLVGFSQGGALALSAAVTEPGCCGAVAVIGGRLPRRVEPQVELPPSLGDIDVLLLHAPDDEVLPPVHAHEAAAFLTAQEMEPTLQLTGRGHALSPPAVTALRQWLERDSDTAPRRRPS